MNDFNEQNLNNTEGTVEGFEAMPQAPQVPQPPQMPQAPQSVVEEAQAEPQQTSEPVAVETATVAEETVPAVEDTVPPQQIKAEAPQPQQRVYNPNYAQRPPYPNRPQPPYPPQGYPQGAPYTQGYNQPPQPNRYPQNQAPQYNNQGQPMTQDYYQMTYGVPKPEKPEKPKMGGGLKALVIIIIAILTACVVGLTVYLALGNASNTNQQSNNSSFFSDDIFGDFDDFYGYDYGYGYTEPTQAPTFSAEQSSGETYEESDASDKVNPDYKGVDLKSKPKDKNSEKYNASYSFEALQEAVIGVVCYYKEDEGTDNYQSQGTGIILTSDGYIVTNSHVIGNSRKAYIIKVITADKKEYKAGVVGYDSRSDLAVLKIDAENLPVAQFGNSDETAITEDVIAIGNPSGIEFQNSVTKGIVSALDRKVSTSNNVEFIQIDAAINPGNSGGPLCNMYGQVIGITTSKIASEAYEGMGFAIPSTTMKRIVDDIIRNSYVTNRVKVGITGTAVYEAQSGADGIQIVAITEGGPLDNTDAQIDDIITAVDGEQVATFAEIFDILEKHSEGDKVKVTLYRPSTGNSFDVEITLQIDKAEE